MYRIVIDTEACGGLDAPLVYDIGYLIIDDNYQIVTTRNYLINEVFHGMPDLMASAHYANKLPRYYEMLAAGTVTIAPFLTVWREFIALCREYHVTQVWAHNASYDRRALNNTIKTLSNGFSRWFLPYGVTWHCTLHAAACTICNSSRYYRFAMANGLVTDRGNVRTNAQAVFAYVSGDPSFIEDHTALSDATIEAAILAKVLRQKKKMRTYPARNAFWPCQRKFRQWREKQNKKTV